MTQSEILKAHIARARGFFARRENLAALKRAEEELDAANACGQGCQLLPLETRALHILLEGHKANLQLRRMEAEAKTKIIPFPTSITPKNQPTNHTK